MTPSLEPTSSSATGAEPSVRSKPGHLLQQSALQILQSSGLRVLLDIGGDASLAKDTLPEGLHHIIVASPSRIRALDEAGTKAVLIEADGPRSLALDPQILQHSVVVCSDLAAYDGAPEHALQLIADLHTKVPYVLLGAAAASLQPAPSDQETGRAAPFAALLQQHRIPTDLIGDLSPDKDGAYLAALAGAHASFGPVPNKRVLAVLNCYNDEDIITEVIAHLLREEVDLYIIDNWSTDATWQMLKMAAEALPQRIRGIERYPEHGPSEHFHLHALLEHKEAVIRRFVPSYDWFVHHDSDEIRTSPWQGVTLAQAISRIDALGYTAIDHTPIDFKPTRDGFSAADSPKTFFAHFEFNGRPEAFAQVKAWRSTPYFDIKTTGGHCVIFDGRRVFPLKFLLSHYSLRSTRQAQRKVYKERIPRFAQVETQRGWHNHYDTYKLDQASNFLWDERDLLKFDADFAQTYLIERLTGVNIALTP